MKKFDPARAAVLDDAERLTYTDPERILALLDPPEHAMVMDFGTGTGVYAIEIAERRPDVHVIALDEQPSMLERLRRKKRSHRDNLEPRLPDVLAELTGSVDRVLALNVLHELDDAALTALRALLTDDGLALVIDWNPEVDRPRGPAAEHLYAPERAVEVLARVGFDAALRDGFPYHLAFVCRPM